ncbi:hypothetical protein KPH14_004771 [Odynerus spinipes]|uniref:Uncharacterized protein n=1 Tax=Odynerus spinipes TaxID=1348599 RepID=A0AAD9RMG5_9HYME|nr:hypothetical protein KPH14_004771 [Odynerus spinipes]
MPPDCDIIWGEASARYKRSKYLREDGQLIVTLRTANMRFLLLVAVCSLAALAAATDKNKRDILPGDPRYGTDYHHQHHSSHGNDVLEVSKSLGGYVGSYDVPELKTSYGPPHHQPGKPISIEQLPNVEENGVEVSSPNYGVPELHTLKPSDNHYLPPVIEETKTVRQFHVPKATVHADTLHTEFIAPSAATPTTSYGSPVAVEIKTEKEVHKPHVTYGIPSVKTSVVPSESNLNVDKTLVHTTLTKTLVPTVKVHDHLKEVKTVHKTELKTPLTLPPAPVHHQLVDDSSLTKTHVDVFPSNDQASFSNVAPISYDQTSTIGSHVIPQPGLVNFDTTYHLQGHNGQFESHVPNVYAGSFGSSAGYGAPFSQAYQVPQSYYPQQVYLPSQYGYPAPYPLTKASFQPYVGAGVDQKTGPIADFFQENFPNFQFPQIPQLPQFPDLGSLFQIPTSAPETAPIDTVEVEKHVEQKTVKVADEHVKNIPTSIGSSLTKGTTVVTKTTKEFTQPIDKNGGYVY